MVYIYAIYGSIGVYQAGDRRGYIYPLALSAPRGVYIPPGGRGVGGGGGIARIARVARSGRIARTACISRIARKVFMKTSSRIHDVVSLCLTNSFRIHDLNVDMRPERQQISI